MLNLSITQSWLEKSSDTSIEEFKAVLVETLNRSLEDRFTEKRWSITKTLQGNTAQLFYDERVLATLTTENGALLIKTESDNTPREDSLLHAIRFTADRLFFTVYSNMHKGARLPKDFTLALDHSFFQRSPQMADFFSKSQFIPRYAKYVIERTNDGGEVASIYPPYYGESKVDGSIHILNDAMLSFLTAKENQETNSEFSYKVADSMDDFAKKYNFGLVPYNFYQNYGVTPKIISSMFFDAFHITRKVFIDPYVWDFDSEHDLKFYQNVRNGLHLMDKVRNGENLDIALKRVLSEELQVANDYVGAKVWGLEFDRDREGRLTPRLKIHVFVHGLVEKHKRADHDWVSVK